MENIIINPTDISTDKINFSTTLNVGLSYVNQAVNMVKAFDAVVSSNEGLDFEKALSIAKNHETFAVIGTKTVKSNSSKTQAWIAIEQLQNLINMVQGAATENWAAFGAAARAFIDLNTQKNGGYFTIFHQDNDSIRYQYNMFNATQNKKTGSVMCGQLTSVEINISKSDANVLALVAGSTITQTLNFKSMTIVEALS
ncbi:type-2Aa cytolytic delta-endotoxin [Endozoicomonas sp. SM1973]|uniref:Type-2Aa cytolytic delta-endotoxin n=1 Tax=Spartinivicinus marinus TaxID=2994442 RepID=A0A853I392_9GAMM|nr:type-2Aa cytolytic delta-endotoxin [Spartinivicinus marinus]MCX4027075.1 hypothetical protein [Spartinivicinus marinus]NYZ67069.1 type-2Aa cytolytic delta-endotoxin [Spartinivicinus marinus]